MAKTVNEIKAIKPIKKLKKVCAYARVSNDKDAMMQSLSAQVSHYNNMISANREWQFAGVYADEGISGTKEDRPQFLKMIEDAKNGLIDMIITKSISRFGRNTETVIRTVRELKAINIDVYFESQNMHTLSEDGEFMLTVLASYYQEEARSVSETMKWRIKKDLEQGIIWGGNNAYGYKFIDKKFIVVPEEAAVVRRVFDLYIGGYGIEKIANLLNDEKIPSLKGLKWSKTAIQHILKNVIYMGDMLLQKSFRPDYMTKKKKRNKGEMQQYYVEDDHEPIVDKSTFMLATEIREARMKKYKTNETYTGKFYPFTHKIKCSCCGAYYRHKVVRGKPIWICSTLNEQGKSKCTDSKQIPEDKLYEAINVYFGVPSFDEKKFANIDYLEAKPGNIISIHLLSGKVDEIKWSDHSRSASWTPEMREKARQKELERIRQNGKSKSNTIND